MSIPKVPRRTFLKMGAGLLAGGLFKAGPGALAAGINPPLVYGREIPSRCPLCSMGCGVVYLKRTDRNWAVEGDPDCPVAGGSLCSRGAALLAVSDLAGPPGPMVRNPGSDRWEEITWRQAVRRLGRRIKDHRDRELKKAIDDPKAPNRFEGMGIISGGNLTNEEAYLVSKLFRSLGVINMDTTVRASRGMAVLGLLEVLGLPAPTHPPVQVAQSDVVFLVGCNPGQTSPVLARALDDVRRRQGVVVVLDPRMSETIKEGDIWLNVRPGCDSVVLGGLMSWVLENVSPRKDELNRHTDAAFMTLSETLGFYERHGAGKSKGQLKTNPSLDEPYSIYQRMRKHYERYDLRRVSEIAGVDQTLLRRAARLLARTGEQEFSACFILGSGSLGRPSGSDNAMMAAMIQALLGNLKKRGGGVVVAAGAGNAQGVCDMGLLSSFLPGYLNLPRRGASVEDGKKDSDSEAFRALLRAWFDRTDTPAGYLPVLNEGETPSISNVLQGISRGKIRALMVLGADPVLSMSAGREIRESMSNLDLLIVVDVLPSATSDFWRAISRHASAVKTEVIFIPMLPPALRAGSMTDAGRRVRSLVPVERDRERSGSLVQVLLDLGVNLKERYRVEGGSIPAPLAALRWPLKGTRHQVVREINGLMEREGEETLLSSGVSWSGDMLCGNRLYRGWLTEDGWQAQRRDRTDVNDIGLFEGWGWFWPAGIGDPFSWVYSRKEDKTVSLRWEEQGGVIRSIEEALPIRSHLPVRFWTPSPSAPPFPEHYEPFYSPLPDLLTGGEANPDMVLRAGGREQWSYLSRRPDRILGQFPVITTVHRFGNVQGTGGVLAQVGWLRELGTQRILEIGVDLADDLKIVTGDDVTVRSPDFVAGVGAVALVTSRLRAFHFGGRTFPVTSLTLSGDDSPGTNDLFPPVFNSTGGGMQVKAFMAKVEKG